MAPYGAEILVVGPLGNRLFPALELPGLRRVETVEAALSWLEVHLMAARSKRLGDAETADVSGHRQASPEDPLPLLLLITDVVPESLDARWRAMLDSATRLGLAALVLIPEHAMDGVVQGSSPFVDRRSRRMDRSDGSPRRPSLTSWVEADSSS